MIIPGIIISILTFPGVIFHELGHQIFCRLTGVRVHEVKYFRLGNPAGYVVHEQPQRFTQSFFITVGPLISGTLFALAFFWLSSRFDSLFFMWLGVSAGMHCFPSDSDNQLLSDETSKHIKTNIFAAIGYPFILVFFFANLLRFFWFDLIYALCLYAVANPSIWASA